MTVDIRATVTCSLGPLISASVSDDYIQGSGLIKTSGSCEISGLVSPAIGSVVTFNYTKSGITRNVPRKLRVLSSFADPFRRTTKVELGCKLTYLSDLKDPIKFRAEDDEENAELVAREPRIVTLPIRASAIMSKCLTELGITASQNPLSNKFSIAEFDFSDSYVQVLSDLLVSESYYGYLNYSEQLVVTPLYVDAGSGPAVDQSKLIDIGPIGVGDLPAEAVAVNYSTLTLKAPDDAEVVCENNTTASDWGESEVTTAVSTGKISVPYELNSQQYNKVYTQYQSTTEQTTYRYLEITNEVGIGKFFDPATDTKNPSSEYQRVVAERRTIKKESAVGVAGGLVTATLSSGANFGDYLINETTIETFAYDKAGNETQRILSRTGDNLYAAGLVNIPLRYDNQEGGIDVVNVPPGSTLIEKIIVNTYTNGNYQRQVTKRYVPWMSTIPGQTCIAESIDSFTTAAQATAFLSSVISADGTYLLDVTTETSYGTGSSQEAPSEEEVINQQYSEGGDPDNGFRGESTAEIEVAVGSPTAQRRIELSMPYAPDDTFIARQVPGSDPPTYCYDSKKSDAKEKAALYGRTQNRILFGNRNGMNLQTVPELLPTAPYGIFYVIANGVVTQYRTNGTSWTMDSNGVVASTDGLYWGVVGKTA